MSSLIGTLTIGLIIVQNWLEVNTMRIIQTIFVLLLVGIVTALVVTAVEVVSADSGIEWTSTPVTEVEMIVNPDFLYLDSGICWGITWNAPQNWTIEIVTGDYFTERVNNFVDYSEVIGCRKAPAGW